MTYLGIICFPSAESFQRHPITAQLFYSLNSNLSPKFSLKL